MNPPLPEAFCAATQALLGPEWPAFLDSYQKSPCRALRLRGAFSHPDILEALPYEENACRLAVNSRLGAHPLHEAGAFYIQEPSAMAAVAALQVQASDKVLDLCAAPGGKATQIGAHSPQGLLVANEINAARAKILSRNVERMGIRHALVTNASPDMLASRFPAFFDRILVDAPCSGEGMFRKDPDSRLSWTPDLPRACAVRQKLILREAETMLTVGGHMVYSTCTFNRTENEEVVADFLVSHPNMTLVPFALPGLPEAPDGMLRLWPHHWDGEGHFIALFRKTDEGPSASPACSQGGPRQTKARRTSQANDRHRVQKHPASHMAEHLYALYADPSLSYTVQADKVSLVPHGLPDLTGLRVLRLGLELALIKGNRCEPLHAGALALPAAQRFDISPEDALGYQKGETLDAPPGLTGYACPTLDGYQLGWSKISEGMSKNLYPKGLRRMGLLSFPDAD